jgi:hypothetical protein
MKKHILIIIAVISLLSPNIRAQDNACGTVVSQAQVTLESGINLVSIKPNESVSQLNTELSVTVYVIKNETGVEGIDAAAINAAFDKLNTAFAPIKLKFRVCNTIFINNYQFNSINASQNAMDLTTQYNARNTINLYFASSLVDKEGNLVPGFTYMPADLMDFIFLDKDYIAGNEIIHQFGHFLGLYHTHETIFEAELVGDANCQTSGDRCCDTPADPIITGAIDNKCDYTGSVKDSKSNFYIPSTNNYMSLGNDVCRCVFTNDQLNRIIYTIQNQKKHLW